MIKVENIDVWGFEHAVRAMRNPMNSWDKSDSYLGCRISENDCIANKKEHPVGQPQKCDDCSWCEPLCYGMPERQEYIVGDKDMELMKKLVKAGVEHRTFARMVMVSMDITAPLYWWKEADRYRFKEQISTSTMHKIHAKEFTLDDFSCDQFIEPVEPIYSESDTHMSSHMVMDKIIESLNYWRENYLESKEKRFWYQMIQLLPSSYNQRRTVMLSYETAMKMIKERSGHKLDEWNDFVKVLENLPYMRRVIE